MRIGIIGTGNMGGTHARNYAQMEGVEIGYRDRNAERTEALARRIEGKPFDSADALIAWADVIDICLPTDLHAEYALRAISAGKATFLEKPIATTYEDGLAVVEAAEKGGVPLMVGQVVRYFPEFEQGKKLVESGSIGTPAAARTRRGGGAPKAEWFRDYSRSGGTLLDLAIHDFDWLRWTLGEVKFLYSRSTGLSQGTWPDYALTTLTFESGAVAHVESTWMDPSGFRTSYEVAGSGGLIQFDSRVNGGLRTLKSEGTRTEAPLVASDDPYFRQLRDFLAAVKNGTPVPVSGRDGLAALSIALAAVESAKTDRVVTPRR